MPSEDAQMPDIVEVTGADMMLVPRIYPERAEQHPVLSPILTKRQRAAANFMPEFSGQRGMDFDRGLLCAFEAVNGALQKIANTQPTPAPLAPDTEALLGRLEALLAAVQMPLFTKETADYAEVLDQADQKVALTVQPDLIVAAVNALPTLIAHIRAQAEQIARLGRLSLRVIKDAGEELLRAEAAEAEAASLRKTLEAAREALRRNSRTAEMSAGIMRDTRRTGTWEGAEKVAAQFDRIAERARAALTDGAEQ